VGGDRRRELAAHCRPESYTEGELVVIADSTAWATQLRFLAPQLIRTLNTELGHGIVKVVVVKGPAAPSWRKGRRSAPEAGDPGTPTAEFRRRAAAGQSSRNPHTITRRLDPTDNDRNRPVRSPNGRFRPPVWGIHYRGRSYATEGVSTLRAASTRAAQ
jgi:hypothetical protein